MKVKQVFLKISLATAAITVIPIWSLSTNVYDDVIVPSLNHTILEEAIVQANLEKALRTSPNLTVFAPTDAAFTALLSDMGITASELLEDPSLSSILLYHVIGEEINSGSLSNGDVVTLNNESVTISVGSSVMINESTVTLADVMADNGIVHVINAVLLPLSLGLEESKQVEISIYPNPTSDFLNINVSNSDITLMSIFDMNGKEIYNSNITANEILLNINTFEPGVYLINFKGENTQTSKRLIIK